MHPYKSVDGRGHGVRPNMDAELEISSEMMTPADEEVKDAAPDDTAEVETVRLVLDKIVEELKSALRHHLTKNLVDTRVSVCLHKRDGDA